jgi:proline dehydrogenase
MVSRLLVRAGEEPRLERLATSHPLARRIALRFVAGEELPDGLAVASDLAARGRRVSLDVVGERVSDEGDADAAMRGYEATIGAIETAGVPAGVSIKPSQLGTLLDVDRARKRLVRLAEAAAGAVDHVTLDMEDSTTTQTTIDLVEALHAEGHTHVGCAVQAYLHRTPVDVAQLCELGASVRLCKGAYAESARVAHRRRSDVDAAYRRLATYLLEHGTYPRLATHDHRLIGHVRREARRLGRASDDLEFQMLYGVRTDVQQRLVAVGERVCVYVPFGAAWYPYLMRRLAERPANLLFALRALWSRKEPTP